MLANKLIDRLEREGLLDQEIIEALRDQLRQTGAKVKPEAIAKLLVDNGQLTRYQATKYIGELRNQESGGGDAVALADDDSLLAPEDDLVEAEVVDAVEAEPVEAEPVDAEPVEAEPVDAGMGTSPPAGRPRPKSTGKRPQKPEHKTVWDSFKVYGYLGIIGFLILAGGGLYWILRRGNADDVIEIANEKYEAGSFQPAQESYQSFLGSFGQDNEYSSLARTRIKMAELYRAETNRDPTDALEKAQELLPTLVEEEGLNQERGNLAALLVDVAQNIVGEAGEASETAKKQQLLDKLDEQMELIDNPNYMLSSMRTTLSGQLREISEARGRVRREISRNIRLEETAAKMKEALEEKKTKAAYDYRDELLRDFPELQDHERLEELIRQASTIQETLVSVSTKLPEVSDQPVADPSQRSIVLTTREGDSIPGREKETYFLRAGGSVLAFSVGDGKLLWRKFTGYGDDHTPLRLADGTAALLSDVNSNQVSRVDGQTGELAWSTNIGEPFVEPSAGRDQILVSAKSGRLLSIATDGGQANWVTQIPQHLDTAPGIDDSLRRVYLPGTHSNLYVLGGRDGKCLESFYMGHDEGTIVVPPVSLLGHLFVVENAGAEYAKIHVLKIDDQGENLKVAQPPVRITGNVTVTPIIQGRRLIVLTDLGEVTVLDVEPTAERRQVSEVAGQVASYDSPTSTQMAVGRGQMWITGTRIGRYELQINTGRVVRDWTRYEGDTFLGPPLALDNALIHARQLRDTASIRVTATNPKTGDQLWKTDVGVPVSMLTNAPEGGFHVVTSGGALFHLDRQSLSEGSTQGPVENPGGSGIAMRFDRPIAVDDTTRVLINQSSPTETLVYNPSRRSQKLRKVQLNLTDGKPTGRAVFSGGGLFLPLDTGRAVLADHQTGSMIGAPFQPASDPTESVKWTNPVPVSNDPDQVLIADDRHQLYRLRAGDQVRKVAGGELETPFLGTIATIGDLLVGAGSGPASDFIAGYDQAGLERQFKTLLDGRVVWGPVAGPTDAGGGPIAVLMTSDGVLRGFGTDGKQAFQVEAPGSGVPVDQLLALDGAWLVAGRDGWLLKLDPSAGKPIGTLDLGQPISAVPLSTGSNLLVPGGEGVVYITEVPGKS